MVVPPRRELTDSHRSALDYVVQRYGRFSGKELIRRTHNEDPWRSVSESDDVEVQSSPVISLAALRRWFEADEEYVELAQKVEQLRSGSPRVYSFDPLVLPEDLGEPLVIGRNST